MCYNHLVIVLLPALAESGFFFLFLKVIYDLNFLPPEKNSKKFPARKCNFHNPIHYPSEYNRLIKR